MLQLGLPHDYYRNVQSILVYPSTVVPDSFTHGTSEQRMSWFRRGFESGALARCDTFEGSASP